MSYSVIDRAGHSNYGVTGSGPIKIFQDGGIIRERGIKPTAASMFEFKDAAGNIYSSKHRPNLVNCQAPAQLQPLLKP
jgi:hypothetical protein